MSATGRPRPVVVVDLASERVRRRPGGVVIDPDTGFSYDAAKLAKAMRWAAARGRQVSEVALARCRIVTARDLRRANEAAR